MERWRGGGKGGSGKEVERSWSLESEGEQRAYPSESQSSGGESVAGTSSGQATWSLTLEGFQCYQRNSDSVLQAMVGHERLCYRKLHDENVLETVVKGVVIVTLFDLLNF